MASINTTDCFGSKLVYKWHIPAKPIEVVKRMAASFGLSDRSGMASFCTFRHRLLVDSEQQEDLRHLIDSALRYTELTTAASQLDAMLDLLGGAIGYEEDQHGVKHFPHGLPSLDDIKNLVEHYHEMVSAWRGEIHGMMCIGPRAMRLAETIDRAPRSSFPGEIFHCP